MRIAQLSDLHLTPQGQFLYDTVDTEAAFLAALERVKLLDPGPDLLVLSGDLADAGSADAYLRLRRILDAFAVPYAVMPGNHDSRDRLRAAFPDQAWTGEPLCCRRLEVGNGSLLLLDSTVPGKDWGEIGDAQLAWLDSACQDERPVLLFLHHPPFDIGVAGMDAIRCRGEARLADWLGRKPRVEGLFCGHVHRFVATAFGGRPAYTAPSTAHQIALQSGPLAYTLEPGGFLLHDWQPGQRLLTHYMPVARAPVYTYGD